MKQILFPFITKHLPFSKIAVEQLIYTFLGTDEKMV